jgi:hypothetical protein
VTFSLSAQVNRLDTSELHRSASSAGDEHADVVSAVVSAVETLVTSAVWGYDQVYVSASGSADSASISVSRVLAPPADATGAVQQPDQRQLQPGDVGVPPLSSGGPSTPAPQNAEPTAPTSAGDTAAAPTPAVDPADPGLPASGDAATGTPPAAAPSEPAAPAEAPATPAAAPADGGDTAGSATSGY